MHSVDATLAAMVAVAAAMTALLAWTAPARPPPSVRQDGHAVDDPRIPRWPTGWSRGLLVVGSAMAAVMFVGGRGGLVAGALAAAAAWSVLARAEPGHLVRRRTAIQEELPHLVGLFAATLRAGQDPVAGLRTACQALPGPAAETLTPVLARADLGDRHEAWTELASDSVLGRLGRTLARAHETGSPVTAAVERLASDLHSDQRAFVEDRARRVGVLAALPLGICLLPAFMLLGIVPTVAAMLGTLAG